MPFIGTYPFENQCLGRIDHVKFPNKTVKMIRDQVGSAISQAGNMRFILAPIFRFLPTVLPPWSDRSPMVFGLRGRKFTIFQ